MDRNPIRGHFLLTIFGKSFCTRKKNGGTVRTVPEVSKDRGLYKGFIANKRKEKLVGRVPYLQGDGSK